MMDFHGAGIKVRFQGIGRVGEGRELMRHSKVCSNMLRANQQSQILNLGQAET